MAAGSFGLYGQAVEWHVFFCMFGFWAPILLPLSPKSIIFPQNLLNSLLSARSGDCEQGRLMQAFVEGRIYLFVGLSVRLYRSLFVCR